MTAFLPLRVFPQPALPLPARLKFTGSGWKVCADGGGAGCATGCGACDGGADCCCGGCTGAAQMAELAEAAAQADRLLNRLLHRRLRSARRRTRLRDAWARPHRYGDDEALAFCDWPACDLRGEHELHPRLSSSTSSVTVEPSSRFDFMRFSDDRGT